MELTLTGASLNSDGGGGGGNNNASLPRNRHNRSSNSNQKEPQCNSHHSHHGHSHNHNHGSSDTAKGATTVTNAGAPKCEKKCCHNHNRNAAPNTHAFVDITTVPKEKLVSNPAILMNSLMASIRGKGTFDTFTYLLHLVLDFERNDNQNQPMKWGKITSDTNASCKSCLNHYSNEGHTIAHWCAKRIDDVRFMEYLVKHVPNVNVNLPSLDNVGMKPIHWACTEGSIPTVAFLLHHCSSMSHNTSKDVNVHTTDIINTLDSSNCTPLLIASQYGHADLVAFLIKRGANPYAVDSAGDTAFHWAAYKGSVPVCSLLLHLHCKTVGDNSHTSTTIEDGNDNGKTNSANASPNRIKGDLYGYLDLQDSFGQCPLHLASLRGNIDVVNFIIDEAEMFVDRNMNMTMNMSMGMNMTSFGRNNKRMTDTSSNNPALLPNIDDFDNENGDGADDNNNNNATSDVESNYYTNNVNIQQFPNMLLNLKDKNGKTPIELAIKKKHISTELVLRKNMDKHMMYNQSLMGKMKVTFSQFLSLRNWLLWMGFVSEGGGRPPKFIFLFVVINLFLASCMEVLIFAPIVWMQIKSKIGNSGIKSVSDDTLRLGVEYIGLHYWTIFGFAMTWTALYLVNQTDPGILNSSSGLSAISTTTSEYDDARRGVGRIQYFVQQLIRRISSYTITLSRFFNAIISSSLWFCRCGSGGENKRIKREMLTLSMDLHRQYEETLESFALVDDSSNSSSGYKLEKKKPNLCHSCHIVKPIRSKHCRVMNHCVLLFDHHCPFVGTTIGLYNYKYFYAFVVFFTITDILFTITGFLHWKHGPVVVDAMATAADVKPSNELWIILIVIYFSLYTMMTGGLSIYHTQLIRMNLTTNEHQNMFKYDYLKKKNDDGSVSFHNPFNNGFLRNFMSRMFPSRDSYTLPIGGGNNSDNTSHVNDNGTGIEMESLPTSSNKKTDDDGGERADLVANIV